MKKRGAVTGRRRRFCIFPSSAASLRTHPSVTQPGLGADHVHQPQMIAGICFMGSSLILRYCSNLKHPFTFIQKNNLMMAQTHWNGTRFRAEESIVAPARLSQPHTRRLREILQCTFRSSGRWCRLWPAFVSQRAGLSSSTTMTPSAELLLDR